MAGNVELGHAFELIGIGHPSIRLQCNHCLHIFIINVQLHDGMVFSDRFNEWVPKCPNCDAKVGDEQADPEQSNDGDG